MLGELLKKPQAKRVIVLVLVGVALLLPPIFCTHPVAYLPIVTYVLVLLFAVAYLAFVRRGLVCSTELEGERFCARRTEIDIPLSVENRSYLPLFRMDVDLRIVNPAGISEGNGETSLLVGPRGQAPLLSHIRLEHVGTYGVELRRVVLHDPFDLLQVSVLCKRKATVVSTPRLVDIDSAMFTNMVLRESTMPERSVISDGADYAGVREYKYGDPLKSIHWKLSARSEGLQTRLFEVDVNKNYLVVIDFHAPGYRDELLMQCTDSLVEIALATARLVKNDGAGVQIGYVAGERSYLGGLPTEADMDVFARDLPLASPEVEAADAAGVLERGLSTMGGFDNVVVCTSALGDRLFAEVVEAQSDLLGTMVVLVVPREKREEYRKHDAAKVAALDAAGVTCIVVSDTSDLEVSVDG